MASAFPFDELTRRRVAQLLYQALPLFYRTEDQPPLGSDELKRFLRVLAAPLGSLRQSIDELHANFFIDTCGDAAIPLLAQIVGTDLVFPDADTNRRDVRGTVSRRQRKGTRTMLEEMGRDLTEQLTVLMEGWQRLIVVQDINQPRRDRVLADLHPITFTSSLNGPTDAAFHLVDIRTSSATAGRYHPRDIVHWVHVTKTFPLVAGSAARVQVAAGDPDPIDATDLRREWRYAFDPLGHIWALRQRATSSDHALRSDRILVEAFAARPADFLGVDGRFSIRVAGLLGAVPIPTREERLASELAVDPEIVRGAVKIELLEHPLRGWSNGRFELSLCLAPTADGLPNVDNLAAVETRATIRLGTEESPTGAPGAVDPSRAVLLRLRTLNGAGVPDDGGGFFAGATVAISGGLPAAGRAQPNGDLAAHGFLRGAVVATLPSTWVIQNRWFYLAADGSIIDAQRSGAGSIDVSFSDEPDGRHLDPALLLTTGSGAAWPPLPPAGGRAKLTTIPPSPGRGPNILHGGRALTETDADVSASTNCALVFAARYFDTLFKHQPIGRLRWTGPNPGHVSAPLTWEVLDQDGNALLTAEDIQQRMRDLVAFRNGSPNQLSLVARFESETAAVMCPAEVVWTSDDGDAVLVYMPERTSKTPPVDDTFPHGQPFVSDSVVLDADGSTRDINGALLRMSEGSVAPLRGPVAHIRRRPRYRSLSAAPGTPNDAQLRAMERCLDVDVVLGRFSLNGEAPQAWPLGPVASPPASYRRPANVTVDFEDAYTAVVGARTAPREILISQLAPGTTSPRSPTRIVARSGVLHVSRDTATYDVPQYSSLTAALDAIAADPKGDETENGAIVQIEDDATYTGESLTWPANVPSLTIQAADSRRPVLALTAVAGTPSYDTLTLKGLAFGGVEVALPECRQVYIQFCTVTDAASMLTITLKAEGRCSVLRSITAGLSLVTPGILDIVDSVVDAGAAQAPNAAIAAPDATVDMQGTTVIGTSNVFILYASECLFVDPVTVADRFHGCIRFSAVAPDSVLPRRHEVFDVPPEIGARFVSLDRHDPAHVRLSDESPRGITTGGGDGSEVGAFNHLKATQRVEAFEGRLAESTPAGLISALIRVN